MISAKNLQRVQLSIVKQGDRTKQSLNQTNLDRTELDTVTYRQNYQADIHTKLILEINRLNKQIDRLRNNEHLHQQCIKNARKLKATIDALQKESKLNKEMYEVQRANHQQLRKFYEKREVEWNSIIEQHKRTLQSQQPSYQTQNLNMEYFSKGDQQGKNSLYEMYIPKQSDVIKEEECAGRKRPIKRVRCSRRKQHSADPIRLNSVNESLQKIFKKGKGQPLIQTTPTPISKKPALLKNPSQDEICDRIMRQTLFRIKSIDQSIKQFMEHSQMKKLKTAKTSTRQRMRKTFNKCNFVFQDAQELQIFCQYIQKIILQQNEYFSGQKVFQWLQNKLAQCQRLANASNSIIQKLDLLDSSISNPHNPSIKMIPSMKEYSSVQDAYLFKLDSSINPVIESIQKISMQSQKNIRYEVSDIMNLSDLINDRRQKQGHQSSSEIGTQEKMRKL